MGLTMLTPEDYHPEEDTNMNDDNQTSGQASDISIHDSIQWSKRMEWRELANCLYMGILMMDRNGMVVFANTYLENMLDYPGGNLVGKMIEDLMPERFRKGHVALRQGYLKEKSPRSMAQGMDLFCLTRYGVEISVQIGLSPMNITEGTFVVASIWRQR